MLVYLLQQAGESESLRQWKQEDIKTQGQYCGQYFRMYITPKGSAPGTKLYFYVRDDNILRLSDSIDNPHEGIFQFDSTDV